MFKPKYSITPNILSNLIKTAEARAVVDNAYLVPKWEVALRREALIKNAHASTAIEGNPLSLEQVSDLAMGRDIMATRKAKAEVVNYLKVYEFVRIHPFIDGNGRAARALASLILYFRGFDTKRFFALDDYYDGDRQAYYRALQSVDSKKLDITEWLEYFTYGVALQIETVKKRVLSLSSDLKRKKSKGQIALTERQMRIVERIHDYRFITNKTIREMFKLSDEGALKELKRLLSLGVIKSEGRGRNIRYLLA